MFYLVKWYYLCGAKFRTNILSNEEKKRKKKLLNDLKFYLENYKEVTSRGQKIKDAFDFEIERIIEELKDLGK